MTDKIFLRNLSSPQVAEAVKIGTVLLIPFGQTEQHGPHLAIGADSIIAESVAEEAARRLIGKIPVLIAPPIQYTYSSELIRSWPGTFIVRAPIMIEYLTDICCSAIQMGFEKVALVSGHGHNHGLSRVAIRQIYDRTNVNVVLTQTYSFIGETLKKVRKSAPGGVCHAGEYETSVLMYLGHEVDLSKTTKDDLLTFQSNYVSTDGCGGAKGGTVFWSTWGLHKSKTGVLGDPTVATVEVGEALFEAMVSEYCGFLTEFYNWQAPE